MNFRESEPVQQKPSLLTKHEVEVKKRVEKLLTARPEYRAGVLKLNFEYNFSTGEVFKAEEDEKGVAHIFIKNEEGVIVDFSNILPSGYKFVTPSFLKSHQEILSYHNKHTSGDILNGWFMCPKDKLIVIGDLHMPEGIFALLHEIGHIYKEEDLQKSSQKDDENEAIGEKNIKEIYQRKIFSNSEKERSAWFVAIQIARRIKEKENIDIFEVFKTKEELTEFIYGALLTHKVVGRVALAVSEDEDRGFSKMWDAMFGNFDREDERDIFFRKLFDKGHLRRGDKK